jgi:hypothetical protein
LSADVAERGDHPGRILAKAGVQFLFDYRIGLGEQVAFTLETSKLPVNTWYVCIDRRRAHRQTRSAFRCESRRCDLRALNPPAARAIDPLSAS